MLRVCSAECSDSSNRGRTSLPTVLGNRRIARDEPHNPPDDDHTDHLGTPRLITNSRHERVAQPNDYPYGEEVTTTGNQQTIDDKKFTGHQRDTLGTDGVADDIDYMHARFYSPILGRFLSADPILGRVRAPQSWNRYSYVQNNPVLLTDPTGLQEKPKTPTADKGLWGLVHNWFEAHFQEWFTPPTASENDPNAQALKEEYGEAKEHPKNLEGNVQQGLNDFGVEAGTTGVVAAVEVGIVVGPNKLHHIFGKATHNLSGLVATLGSEQAAYRAIYGATESAVASRKITGLFETSVTVADQTVTVRGNVIDGVVKIGTFFVP